MKEVRYRGTRCRLRCEIFGIGKFADSEAVCRLLGLGGRGGVGGDC